MPTAYAYQLLIAPASAERPEVERFAEWIRLQARPTREAIAAK